MLSIINFKFNGQVLTIIDTLYSASVTKRSYCLKIVDDCLEAISENGIHYTFFIDNKDKNGRIDVYEVNVIAYIKYIFEIKEVNVIRFYSNEINGIYPSVTNIQYSPIIEVEEQHKIECFKQRKSEEFVFKLNNKKIIGKFDVSMRENLNNINTTISFDSFLQLTFSLYSYKLIFELIKYIRKFIEFLNFRSNIAFNKIKLYLDTGDCLSYIGDVHYTWKPEKEIYPIKFHRFINYNLLNGSINNIYDDLISNKLYLRHLPKTYHESKFIDPARFILDVTAFEWEYRLKFPQEEPKEQEHERIKREVSSYLEDRINKTKGYEKRIYIKLRKDLMNSHIDIKTKIVKFYTYYEEILDELKDRLYSYNGIDAQNSTIDIIGKRIAEQRNDFAHGNLDKNFNEMTVIDLFFLEYMGYASQLSRFKMDKDKIVISIERIFNVPKITTFKDTIEITN